MGIKNISKLLKKHTGIYRCSVSAELGGARIAVDTPIYLSKCMYSYLPTYIHQLSDDEVKNFTKLNREQVDDITGAVVGRFMTMFKAYIRVTGATFLMIMEGDGKPGIKDRYAGVRRRDDSKRCRERYEQYLKDDKIQDARRMLSNLDLISLGHLSDALIPELSKAGYEHCIAPGESERHACDLRSRGLVDHILTTDTDCLAMKQSFINNIDTTNHVYTLVDYDAALANLDLTPSQFTDLCIMCGCDYNDNIPRVGVIKSYKLIKEHLDIETVSTKMNADCLNYETCRQLFCLAQQPSTTVGLQDCYI